MLFSTPWNAWIGTVSADGPDGRAAAGDWADASRATASVAARMMMSCLEKLRTIIAHPENESRRSVALRAGILQVGPRAREG
ncbi:MAG: hypothetical protein IPO58_24170 [Betaproteobacteria bacterium]|nr:hypothetical protein [Betaproteobacteria bacterium]